MMHGMEQPPPATGLSLDMPAHNAASPQPPFSPTFDHSGGAGGGVREPVRRSASAGLSSPEAVFRPAADQPNKPPVDMADVQEKLDKLRSWSMNTFKITRQSVLEHLGKTERTVDADVEKQVQVLRDKKTQYSKILSVSRGMASYLNQMTLMQAELANAFDALAPSEPQIKTALERNAAGQRCITHQAQELLKALNFFNSTLETLVEKTIEDTIATVRSFEQARLSYDAHRADVESVRHGAAPSAADREARLRQAELSANEHRMKYEQLRDDVQVKIRLLDEHRIKVMDKQLLLLHNATSAYFSGNQKALEQSLKQFSIRPSAQSFLEK